MGHSSAKAIPLAAAIAVFVGCESLNAPPGMTHATKKTQQAETQPDISAEADFAIIAWYLETNSGHALPKDWKQFLDKNQTRAINELQQKNLKALSILSKQFITPDNETFVKLTPAKLPDTTRPEEVADIFDSLRLKLFSPEFTVPLKECLANTYWDDQPPQTKADFQVWATDRTLKYPPFPPTVNSDALKTQFQQIAQAYQAKLNILQLRAQAKDLTDDGQFIQALNLLQSHPEWTDSKDLLTPLEDSTTIPQLVELIRTMPDQCISWTLAELQRQLTPCQERLNTPFNPVSNSVTVLDKTLAQLETQATAAFSQWRNDPRFAAPLDAHRKDIQHTTRLLANVRTAVTTQILEDLFAQKFHWNAFQAFIVAQSQLTTPADTRFGLYAAEDSAHIGAEVISELHGCLVKHAREATEILYGDAEKELRINCKYGYALALCHMIGQIADTLGPKHEGLVDDVRKKADTLAAKAIAAMEENALRRTVSIAEMSSPITGLGLTCTLDVKHYLDKAIKDNGLKNIAIVAKDTPVTTPYSYALYDGVVADFDGQETVERQSTRTVRLYGEIRKTTANAFQGDNNAPQTVYVQNVREQLINMREVERIAHIRIFASLRGPGFTTDVELNEFYSRRFLLEESHLFNDVRIIDILKASAPEQLPAPDTLPELHYDRIWTAGELLDWARKDALAVFTMKLLFHLKQFPFLLENNARHAMADGNHALATEQWGLCYTLTRNFNHEQYSLNSMEKQPAPLAKCYPQCRDNLLRQNAELSKLAKNALHALLEAANLAYMNKQH